ncbi:TasA family protein [Halobaculum sp. MBLA0147]|uniref:TasA family protein n=1 Tax=Halobaculum sp. MBLA0147 TaxID=3079934 RepID=UPI003526976B
MSDDDSGTTFELTRRRVLGGALTVGAASAATGAGTFALFSDSEESNGNSVQAGTLDLAAGGNNGTNTTTLSVTKARPGQSGTGTRTLKNVGSINGFLNLNVRSVSSDENGLAEPEKQAGDSSKGSGELGEHLNLTLGFGGDEFATGSAPEMENVQFNPNKSLPGNNSTEEFEIGWEIDENAGNEVQTDSVSIDFTFELLQEAQGKDVVLTADTVYGEGDGFANPWDTTSDIAQSGSGAWGTVDHSEDNDSYKQGFYFAGDFSSISTLSGYTIGEIGEISYSLYEPTSLNGNDIYLLIYTRPENDGNDGGWYDSRLVALPAEANGSDGANFTPEEWNRFSTRDSASNTLVFDDSGHKDGNSVGGPDLPTLNELQSDSINWNNYDSSLSSTFNYQNQEVMALSLQTNSGSPELEAWIDDITVELTTGEKLNIDLEP